MNLRHVIFSRKGLVGVTCLVILGFVGCITIPLGDPEKSKVDDKLLGAWISAPDNGKQELFTVVQYDARTCFVSEFEFEKNGDTIKPGGRFDWKMWLVDVKGTQFASMEMINPQMALDPQEGNMPAPRSFATADKLTITPVKDDTVKKANITTSQQLQDFIADNLSSPDLFSDPLVVTKVKDDQKDAIGKVFDAFSNGRGQVAAVAKIVQMRNMIRG